MRKSAATLRSQPIKLSKDATAFLRELDSFSPEPGFERLWNYHLEAHRAAEAEWARYTAIEATVEKEGGTHTCKSWPAFEEQRRRWHNASRSAFVTLDAYLAAVAKKDDLVPVPEDEIRAIAIDSLSDKLDEIEFRIPLGLLGSKVAQAIRGDVSEASSGEAVFCDDCND